MKNKIIRIKVARYVDNTVITFARANYFSKDHESDAWDNSISEYSVERFYNTFNPLLKDGKWKAINIGEYGSWETGLTVLFAPVRPVGTFTVMAISRDTLTELGFDTSTVTDSMMSIIARKAADRVGDYELLESVVAISEAMEIPRLDSFE